MLFSDKRTEDFPGLCQSGLNKSVATRYLSKALSRQGRLAEATASVRTIHGRLGEPSLPSQFQWPRVYLNRSSSLLKNPPGEGTGPT